MLQEVTIKKTDDKSVFLSKPVKFGLTNVGSISLCAHQYHKIIDKLRITYVWRNTKKD